MSYQQVRFVPPEALYEISAKPNALLRVSDHMFTSARFFFMNRQNEIDRAMKSVPIIFFEQTGTTESRLCGGRRIV